MVKVRVSEDSNLVKNLPGGLTLDVLPHKLRPQGIARIGRPLSVILRRGRKETVDVGNDDSASAPITRSRVMRSVSYRKPEPG